MHVFTVGRHIPSKEQKQILKNEVRHMGTIFGSVLNHLGQIVISECRDFNIESAYLYKLDSLEKSGFIS